MYKFLDAEKTLISCDDGSGLTVVIEQPDSRFEDWSTLATDYAPPDPEQILADWRAQASCSVRQARLAIGKDTCVALDVMADAPETPWEVSQTIKYATTWERNSEDVALLGWALGYTDEQIDDLFRLAITL